MKPQTIQHLIEAAGVIAGSQAASALMYAAAAQTAQMTDVQAMQAIREARDELASAGVIQFPDHGLMQ